MNIVNIPVPILNTYGDPKIERQIIGIDTSGMKALYKSNIETDIWYCMITTTDSLKIFDIRTLMDDETFNKVLNDPEVRKSLQSIGAQIDGGSVAEFTKFSQSEVKRYEGIVKMSGAPRE